MTPRQLEILRVIAERSKAAGFAPSVRELAVALDISSLNGVMDHLRALVKRGLIVKRETTARSIRLTKAGRKAIGLTTPVGAPAKAIEAAIDWLENHGASGAGSDDDEGLVDLLADLRAARLRFFEPVVAIRDVSLRAGLAPGVSRVAGGAR